MLIRETQMSQEAFHAAMKRLEAFVGEWKVEASFPGSPPGRAVFEWELGGQYLVQRTQVPDPAPDNIAIIAPDPLHNAYTQHYFDSRGVVRVYAMTFNGGAWMLWRNSPDFSPLDFSQRFIGKFSDDGQTITGAWETSMDGATYEHDFDLIYTKITKKRRRSPAKP
jgi:hypothetical protein